MPSNDIKINLAFKQTGDVNAMMRSATAEINRMTEASTASHRKISQGVTSISTQLENYKTIYLGLFQALPRLASGAQALLTTADAWKTINAKLANATDGYADFNRAQAQTIAISRQTGQSLEAVSGLYSKLRMNAGMAAGDAEKLTAVLARASQLDGGGESVKAGLFQLQQALASGVLRGDELNSVLEQTPSIALAIARGLKVPQGELRKLAEDGKLTADAVKKALFDQADAIDKQFSALPVTAARAFQNLKTAAMQEIGSLDGELDLSGAFAGMVQSASQNFRGVVAVAGTSAAAITAAWLQSLANRASAEQAAHLNSLRLIAEKKAAEVAAARVSLSGLSGAEAVSARQNLALLASQSVAAKTALEGAGKGGSVFATAMTAIGGAIRLLTGPIGLAITGVAALTGLLYSNRDAVIDLGHGHATVTETLKAGWDIAVSAISGAVSGIGEFLGLSSVRWGDLFEAFFDRTLEFGKNFVNGIIGAFVGLGDVIGNTAGFIVTQFKAGFGSASDLVAGFVKDVQAALSGDFSMSNFKKTLSSGLDSTRENWSQYAESVKGSMDKALGTDYLGGALKQVGGALLEQVRINRDIAADKSGEAMLNATGQAAAEATKKIVGAGDAKKAALSEEQKYFAATMESAAAYGRELDAQIAKGGELTKTEKALADARAKMNSKDFKAFELLARENEEKERALEAAKALKKAEEERNAETKRGLADQQRELDALTRKNDLLEMGIEAVEDMAVADAEAALSGLDFAEATVEQVEAMEEKLRLAKALRAEAGRGESLRAAKESAQAAAKEWEKTTDQINQSLTDALMRGFESGKDFASNFKDSLVNMFKTLVLRPIISAVMSPISGAIGMGMSALGLSGGASAGGMDWLGMAGQGYSLYSGLTSGTGVLGNIGSFFGLGGGAATASLAGGSFASAAGLYPAGASFLSTGLGSTAAANSLGIGTASYLAPEIGAIYGAGEVGAGLYSATATTATTTGIASEFAAAVAAIPVWGWIIAALAAVASVLVKPKGGPKREGEYIGTFGEGDSYALTPGTSFASSWLDEPLKKVLNPVMLSSEKFVNRYGGSLNGQSMSLGMEIDPQGTAQDRVYGEVRDSSGKLVYDSSRGYERGEGAGKITEEIPRMQLALLSVADGIPELVKQIIAGVDLIDASAEQIAGTLTHLGDVGTLMDYTNANPVTDVMTAIEEQAGGLWGAYNRAESAQNALIASYDGSAAATATLAASTTARYQQELALIGQIQNAMAATHEKYSSSIDTVRMSVMTEEEKYKYLRSQTDTIYDQLSKATDPAEIERLSNKLNDTTMQAWNTLTPEQRQEHASEFEQYLLQGDQKTQERLQAAQDQIVANHNAMATAIKTAMDKAAADMAAAMVAAINTPPPVIRGSTTVRIEYGDDGNYTQTEVSLA